MTFECAQMKLIMLQQSTVEIYKAINLRFSVSNDSLSVTGSITEWSGTGRQSRLLSADSSYRRLSHEVDLKCRSYIIYLYDTTVWLSAKTVTSIQVIDNTYNGVHMYVSFNIIYVIINPSN